MNREEIERTLQECKASYVLVAGGDNELYEIVQWLEEQLMKEQA